MNKLLTYLMLIMIAFGTIVVAESDSEATAEESAVESTEESNDESMDEQQDDDESDSLETDEDDVTRDSSSDEQEDQEQAIPENQESEDSSVDSDNENDEDENDEDEDDEETEDDDLEDIPEKEDDDADFDNMGVNVDEEDDDDVWDVDNMEATLAEAKEVYSNMDADAELEKNKADGLVRVTNQVTLDGQSVDIGDADLASKMMQDIYTNEKDLNEDVSDLDQASRSAAYIAAELSADVYENTKVGKYKSIKGKNYYVRHRFTHNKSGANAAIYEQGNNVYLVFEGTKNEWRLKDWRTNLKINKKTCIARDGTNYGKCHAGFRDSYNLIASLSSDGLMKALKGYKARRKALTLTGHSLGGALATMAAIDVKARSGYGTNFQIITFGSPRVGDNTFAARWNANFGSRSDRYVMEFKAGTCPFSDNHGTTVQDDDEDQDFWRRRRRRRGFFKKVAKGVKKVAKKVAKGVKKVAKGVAKVAKKVVKAVVGKKRTGRDLVTRIPPKSFGFSHVRVEKILTSKHSCSLYCCHKYNVLLMIKVHAIKDYAEKLK